MTPIEKNIIVVDEQGNQIGVTYPKRAKGLVKNGRARYVDESTICLACPPDHDLEDNTMNETLHTETIEPQYTVEYILSQLDKIASNTAYIQDAIVSCMGTKDGTMGMGLGNLVEEREKTNRLMIMFYQRMYDDLVPKKLNPYEKQIEMIIQAMSGVDDSDQLAALGDALRLIMDHQ